jgi:antirestriction protein ArdC
MSDRTAKISQTRAEFERAVAALRDSAAWRRNLRILARFHQYSWHNQLLIGCQCPEASFVRGFKSWLNVGRAVRKGERGIRIFAPRPWQREETDKDGAEHITAGVNFAVTHVFDVSQTDPIPGHPDPWQPPARHAAVGDIDVAAALWSALSAHATTLGLTVSTRDATSAAGIFGYYSPSARHIWVRPDRPLADMTATLAHELAHAVTAEATAGSNRGTCEVIAESVAYAVCTRFGLDLELRSAHYVATWLDDAETFRAGMAAIHAAAASLIDALEAELTAPDVLPLAA